MKLTEIVKRALVPLVAAVTLVASPTTARADFYDGVRGPSTAQVHYTANFEKNTTNHALALKYFGEHIFGIGVLTTDTAQRTGGFSGLGYLLENFDRVKALPVVGYNLSADSKKGTAVGVLQATTFLDSKGTFLLDPRYVLAVPAHGQQSHTPQHTIGLTVSVGNERIRFGPDVNYQPKSNFTGGGLLRYDIDAERHSSWVEVGIGQKGNVQVQFMGNF